jgi:cyanosortase A-associated protein
MAKSFKRFISYVSPITVLIGLVTVSLHVLLSPKSAIPTDSSAIGLMMPVQLPGWQSIGLPTLEAFHAEVQFNAAKKAASIVRHRYQHKNLTLSMESQMIKGDGDISRLISVYSSIQSGSSKLLAGQRFNPQVGHYSVLTGKGKIYLTACINPTGNSTVTEPQFRQARFKSFHPAQVAEWFFNQAPLVDDRCLWTLMSITLPPKNDAVTTPEQTKQAYQQLEQAWIDWYQWWKENFPAN